MGMLSRALVPRGVRRAAHPVRTAKSAATPRVVKQARNVVNPIDSARYYGVERPLNTKPRKQGRPRTLAALDESETGNTPEQNRAISQAALAVVFAVVVAYIVLSLIFGWAVVLVTTIFLGFVIGKAVSS
jgi:Flp pilus assembly protein TadB